MSANEKTGHPVDPPSEFSQLVIMLATSAMQQMGRIPNPSTGKAEVSLEGAQATIDILDMLAKKTRGNLDADEERLLGQSLHSLRLSYVDVVNRGAAPAAPTPPPAAPEQDTAAEPNVEAGADSSGKSPKFHKKYE
ncbi:MAG: DUF1844 domain-containing protein [Verrucomicrobia bacterium]|nr:DUF1844 domain-containing protein [Verrucomicrobiota bacterium]